MTPEKQRIAIAEACGWKPQTMLRCHKCDTCYENPENKPYEAGVFCPECKKAGYVLVGVCHVEPIEGSEMPDYLNDLNAMHDAEKVLGNDLSIYFELLTGGDDDYEGCYKAMCATAAQRAEAFLRTIGKWEPSTPTQSAAAS